MIGNATFVSDPFCNVTPSRQFTFDHSYWSHDGFQLSDDGYIMPEEGNKYVDQRRLFTDLGTGLLESAWSGYNCTLFAYGQTGSGKTYSMMGYGPNKGMVPMLSERLFNEIARKGKYSGVIYQVSFSMLEIYNEKVFDLLQSEKQTRTSLPVRMTLKNGFCVDGLKSYPVSSYRDIEYYIEECNKHRTVAVTKMNETSSRAHTIVTISFLQNYIRENRTKMSKINLVDLAGSERASQTGAVGVRFEESKNINKSLMSLGIVIKNLCALACGRTDQGPTPYRDSKLTMLLKDAIGGNCKTIMVATISPSDQDYQQTLSTLRYADRVKSIRNEVVVNVTKTDKLIKELLAEKETLLEKLKGRRTSEMGYTEEEITRLKEKQLSEIEQIKSEMVNVEKAWQTKLQETKQMMEVQIAKERKLEKQRAEIPHMWNLNEDPSLSGKVFHFIRPGEMTTIGNSRALNPPVVELHGPSIAKEQGVLHNKNALITLMPLQGQIRVNGKHITEQTTLKHQDRIFFSANNLFVFHNPSTERQMRKAARMSKTVTFEMAQNEIGKHSTVDSGGLAWLKEEIGEMLVQTHEANAMAMELGRGIRFEPIIVPTLVLGNKNKRSQVNVQVNTSDGGEFLWGKNNFLDRFDLMMAVFQKYESGETDWEPSTKTQDPFWEPLETPTLIGVAFVPLEPIAYMLDIDEQKIGIYDYQTRHVGHLTLSLVPCTACGEESSEEISVEEPIELLGQNIMFKVKIKGATGIPKRFKSMIEYLEEESLMLEIYGRQRRSSDLRRGSSVDAYTIADKRRMSSSSGVSSLTGSTYSSYTQQSISGVVLEEETEHEEEEAEDQGGQHAQNERECSVYSEQTESPDSDRTSNCGITGEQENKQEQVREIHVESSAEHIDNTTIAMKEMRHGIASVMDEIIKRDGLSGSRISHEYH